MPTKVTEGIKVSAVTSFQEDYSSPMQSSFVFSYRITIENNTNHPVKLLRRHWYIFDSNGSVREVEGKGIIGKQPVIEPGKTYEYESACNLNSEIGKMYGTYLMEKENNQEKFFVRIPEFQLVAPYKYN